MQMLSTYRLQFHKRFTFRDAAAIVPYLHELGVTHVYASPYLKAVAGSTHGYDVIDHRQLNPQIGNEEDYRHFVATLSQHGMSHILDTVPNHMGVDTNENEWWNDVLAHGIHSKFANYFDINWNQFPPRSALLNKLLLPVLGDPYGVVLEKEQLQLRSEEGKLFVYYYDRRFPISGDDRGDLNALLENQNYRLCHWRVAADEINYRRFFDVTSLAALQMERQEVFDAAHDFTFRLIANGSVTGLRVDHPDGLLDPKQYFNRLQEKFRRECPQQAAEGEPLYVSVEKILNGDEELRDDWAVAGTSGYDFLYAVNDLFVNTENEKAMTAVYTDFIGDSIAYADLVYQKKRMILETSLRSELTALSKRLDALAQTNLSSRDFTFNQLSAALAELIACFPVYRSYVSAEGVCDADVRVVHQALGQATLRNPTIDAATLQFVADAVLLRQPDPAQLQLPFAQRFQQLTSPVNAKGIEDTVFYIYNRLTSLNEVGGDPGRFGRSKEQIHRYFEHRNKHWPRALSSLSTHDTKRSEDVRARINVLSEIPAEWADHLQQWKKLNAGKSELVHPNDQYLLYQTLIGAWPLLPMDNQTRKIFVERIRAYMQKAMREAKQRTSWTVVNKEYETAVSDFIAHLIDPESGRAFLQDFLPFQQKISRWGIVNSLAQTVIRLTAPGIPDTYQGTELWDFSLVDPDNRRPIDYEYRTKNLLNRDESKLQVTRKLLQLRLQFPAVFIKGDHLPITVSGARSTNVFAFARKAGDQWIITAVPRLTATLPAADKWNNTTLILPEQCESVGFKDALTDNRHTGRGILISQIFSELPAAVLVSIP